MEQISLKVKKRETGKSFARNFRRKGLVPGVFYKSGEPSIAILSDPISLRPIVYTSETHIISLQIEGETESRDCVLKDATFDPINESMVHFDLIGLSKEPMTFEVPLVLTGIAIGIRDGGIIQHSLHKLPVKCLPVNLPAHVSIDITHLGVGKSIYISDLPVDNYTIDMPGETVLVSCTHSRTSKAIEVAATEAAAAPAAAKGGAPKAAAPAAKGKK